MKEDGLAGAERAGREPVPLPMLGERAVRGDAATNRTRILAAARALLDSNGPSDVSMEAVAAGAGVGKGTVFRRFGDRAGLMAALINDYMRDFQDAFLSGPPPLGPGAPADERLHAFVTTLMVLQRDHLPIALAAEPAPPDAPDRVYGTLLLHAATLIREIDRDLDPEPLAAMILGAVAPPVLTRIAADRQQLLEAINRLLLGVTGPTGRGDGDACS